MELIVLQLDQSSLGKNILKRNHCTAILIYDLCKIIDLEWGEHLEMFMSVVLFHMVFLHTKY